jgi:hypothetical protein
MKQASREATILLYVPALDRQLKRRTKSDGRTELSFAPMAHHRGQRRIGYAGKTSNPTSGVGGEIIFSSC